MEKILNIPIDSIASSNTNNITHALEQGQVVFFPHLPFTLLPTEESLLDQAYLVDLRRKNVSYDPNRKILKGCAKESPALPQFEALMQRYADFAMHMVEYCTPTYQKVVKVGRTSFRPVEIEGRSTSKLKDDTKLHVDAFSSTPVQGKRLLRVFANINPHGQARRWLLGEPFMQVAERFMTQAPRYSAFKAKTLRALKLTKSLRTPYDHYMLHLHNSMKLDPHYQQHVDKDVVDFPPGSCWMVYTDQVSHAALSGQFLLEQTFYLSPEHMLDPSHSPLRMLEKITKEPLA